MSLNDTVKFLLGKFKEYWQVPVFAGVLAVITTLAIAIIQNNWFSVSKYFNDISNINSWNLSHIFILALIILLIVAFVSIDFYKKYMTKKYRNDRKKSIDNIGIGYYPNRDTLGNLSTHLGYSDTVFCLWHGTPGDAYIYTIGNIKKVLIIAPELNLNQPYLSCLNNSYPKISPKEWANDAIDCVNKNIKGKIDVRALYDTPKFLLNILNPYKENGRILLEEFDLKTKKSEWQTFVIEKEKQPYLFKTILEYYESLWEKGKEHKWEKLKT